MNDFSGGIRITNSVFQGLVLLKSRLYPFGFTIILFLFIFLFFLAKNHFVFTLKSFAFTYRRPHHHYHYHRQRQRQRHHHCHLCCNFHLSYCDIVFIASSVFIFVCFILLFFHKILNKIIFVHLIVQLSKVNT